MLKDLFISLFRPLRIFNLKDNKWSRVIITFLFLSLIFTLPMILGVTYMKSFPFGSFDVQIVNDYEEIKLEDMSEEFKKQKENDNYSKDLRFDFPSGVYIRGNKFYADPTIHYEKTIIRTQEKNNRVKTEYFTIVINPDENFVPSTDKNEITIVFYGNGINEEVEVFELYFLGNRFYLTLSGYNEDIQFNLLNNMQTENVMRKLLNGALISAVNEFAWFFDILIYVVVSLINFLFLIVLAGICRLLKYRDSNLPRFSEILRGLVYCSVWPSVIGIIFGVVGWYPVAIVIYNFAIPLIAVAIYIGNKQIIKGDTSSKEANDTRYLM